MQRAAARHQAECGVPLREGMHHPQVEVMEDTHDEPPAAVLLPKMTVLAQ